MIAGPLLSRASDVLLESVKPGVVAIGYRGAFGAGVVWPNGLIVTNDHVAQHDRQIVSLYDGREFEGHVIARDRSKDLAAIALYEEKLHSLEIGSSRALQVGELVIALGHPLGKRDHVTFGIVSGNSGAVRLGRMENNLLVLDIRLAPGNSGGPILDAKGALVGIACMMAGPGIGLAIPELAVSEFMERVIPAGRRIA